MQNKSRIEDDNAIDPRLHDDTSNGIKIVKQLREIIEHINSGFSAVTIDEDHVVHFAFANSRYYAVLGYDKAQFEAEIANAFDVLHPDDRARIEAVVDGVMRSRQPDTYEYRIIRRDGEVRNLRCNASIASITGVGETVLLSVITDITEMVEAERLVNRTAEQLQAIIENINGGVTATIIQDRNPCILFANDQYYAQLGYTKEQFEAEVSKVFLLVHPEDRERVIEQTQQGSTACEPFSITYRVICRDGSVKWMQSSISLTKFSGIEEPVQLAVANDITAAKLAEEKLRVSEEQFRIAAAIGSRAIARYDIKTGAYYHQDKELLALGFPNVIENVPQAFIDAGVITPEFAEAFLTFFERLKRGECIGSLDSRIRTRDGEDRWCRLDATVITDTDGKPSQAIIAASDITEQREKEAVYLKWQQSLGQKSPGSYTLLRCNLSADAKIDSAEGTLMQEALDAGLLSFYDRTQAYGERLVYSEDRESYLALMNVDTLLANYYRGKRTQSVEYREMLLEGGLRWLRLTVELVEYPNSTDVAAYLMYEDIDERKRSELSTKERADVDPLTGVLNRAAFAQRMDALIRDEKTKQHTLLLLDIDWFKQLNDTFGHAAGDRALIEIAASLRSVLRHGDLLGRLGGDEFLITLRDVPYDAIVEKKAKQICMLVRKSFSQEVQISASIGIAAYPGDGEDFDTLYCKADAALYDVKGTGKDGYAFFGRGARAAQTEPNEDIALLRGKPGRETKRRMLIVDDNEINRKILARIFQEDFVIETAIDGEMALKLLRHYRTGLSVVLLDLVMPGMNGFEVLEKMRVSEEMRSVPVIVVSGTDERETSLQAIQCGASDFVTKPIDPALIRLRVQSVISKAENERLRAQNSYLLLQSNEEAKYRTVLDSTGTVVIEYDWINGVFSYDDSIVQHIAGRYDGRKLWHILLSDLVADAKDVKRMQDLVHAVANDRNRGNGSMVALLKTPQDERHWFRISVFKRTEAFDLADKLILTFNNINEEVLADEKLRFQAERDELTGLYNRRTFLNKAEEMVRSQPASAYLMCVGDVDNFKMVNDRYGHAEGDKLLRYIAETLRQDVEKVGGLCGRLGNDVFATLTPNTPAAVRKTSAYPRELLTGYPIKLETTCSIGYYIIDNPDMSVDGMLDRASMAKHTVKGNYEEKVGWYDEDMRQKLVAEQEIAGAMEAALSDGLFDIFLQPQFNHATGQIFGVEALVRWLHQGNVMFLPGEFIPLFEKNGFIIKLDEYVWNRTAELFKKWIDRGYRPVPISVNVSRMDTHDPMLCEKLLGILERNEVPIELFRLEITESLFEEDSERLIEVIDKLHAAGFVIEMDDFGSGYSSLNVLKDVPVDILKLDMRFFSGTSNTERSGVILSAVMRMARWLNISVVAEGVETKAQADYLASIGCPIVQGYLYAAPMPVEEFEKLMTQNAAMPQDGKRAGAESVAAPIDLWALEAEDSELFYNDANAAVIFEYRKGIFEALRANRRFYEIMQLDVDAPLPVNGLAGMHMDDAALFHDAAQRAIATGAEEKAVVRRVFDDGRDDMPLCCTLRMIPGDSDPADLAVLLCSVTRP